MPGDTIKPSVIYHNLMRKIKKPLLLAVVGILLLIIFVDRVVFRDPQTQVTDIPPSPESESQFDDLFTDTAPDEFINPPDNPQPTHTSYVPSAEIITNSDTHLEGKTVSPRGDKVFLEKNDYHFTYYAGADSFLIGIFNSPFEEVREKAEEEFLDVLFISEREACELNVSITTPRFANPGQFGKSYPLSFCN